MKNDQTPIPGRILHNATARQVVTLFLEKFGNKDGRIPSNIPVSCTIQGIKKKEIFNSSIFLKFEKVYLFFDFDNQLRETSPINVTLFYYSKQPWEDYDFCVFNDDLKWCIGVTHNGDVILADLEGRMWG